MPKLWNESIGAHRRAVRDAILDAAAALLAEHGLTSVSMSGIAKKAGIGRATLYKYFPDVEAILIAWHEREVLRHLEQLRSIGAEGRPGARLSAVLEGFAFICHHRHGGDFVALLHQRDHVTRAHRHLKEFVAELVQEGARMGDIRTDVVAGELAGYCLHALTAAGSATSKAAVRRLVEVTMSGLRAKPYSDASPAPEQMSQEVGTSGQSLSQEARSTDRR